MPPLELDVAAKAPTIRGYGDSDIPITTTSPQARELFNDGVLQAYAFNEVEAIRNFKAALAKDPACAMCAWGVAWQLGPNINDPRRTNAAEALNYVDHALRNRDRATPREQALIDSLALRYAHTSTARETAPLLAGCGTKNEDSDSVHPLDVAYAERMRTLADRYPTDPDILSLYAEAEMIATEESIIWSKEGKPAGRMGEVTRRLETLIAASPMMAKHVGLTHYLVHAVDAPSVAARGAAAADQLGKLAPMSPHLVHMPSHIYVHLGRFGQAAAVNERAVANDVALAQTLTQQGFSISKDWRGHNQHFLWYAAIMAGRETLALATADDMRSRYAANEGAFFEFVRSMRIITLVRTERWDQLLKEPLPTGDRGVAQAWYEYGRGMAQARQGRVVEAEASLARLQTVAASTRARFTANTDPQRTARALVNAPEAGLKAELAFVRGQADEAMKFQAEMIEATAKIDAREPPMLADGTRLTLGQLQARAQRWPEAEATYRQALAERPGSGWALRGLLQALRAQGNRAEAEKVKGELDRQWGEASAHLRGV